MLSIISFLFLFIYVERPKLSRKHFRSLGTSDHRGRERQPLKDRLAVSLDEPSSAYGASPITIKASILFRFEFLRLSTMNMEISKIIKKAL